MENIGKLIKILEKLLESTETIFNQISRQRTRGPFNVSYISWNPDFIPEKFNKIQITVEFWHGHAYMVIFINDHGQGASLLLKIRLKSKDLLCTFAQQSVAPCLNLLSLNPRWCVHSPGPSCTSPESLITFISEMWSTTPVSRMSSCRSLKP